MLNEQNAKVAAERFSAVSEAILEERQKYEKNRKRRINDKNNPFYDGNYICCSTYGKPRSSGFHANYYKKLLEEKGIEVKDFGSHDTSSVDYPDIALPVCESVVSGECELEDGGFKLLSGFESSRASCTGRA